MIYGSKSVKTYAAQLSSYYCCYRNHTVDLELNMAYFYQK